VIGAVAGAVARRMQTRVIWTGSMAGTELRLVSHGPWYYLFAGARFVGGYASYAQAYQAIQDWSRYLAAGGTVAQWMGVSIEQ